MSDFLFDDLVKRLHTNTALGSITYSTVKMDSDTSRIFALSKPRNGSICTSISELKIDFSSSSSDESSTTDSYWVPSPYPQKKKKSKKKHGKKHSRKHGKSSVPPPPKAFYVNLENEKNLYSSPGKSRRDSSSSEKLSDGQRYTFVANSPRTQLISPPVKRDENSYDDEQSLVPNQRKLRQTRNQGFIPGSLVCGRESDDFNSDFGHLFFSNQRKKDPTYDERSLYGPVPSRRKSDDDSNFEHHLFPIQRKMRQNHYQDSFHGSQPTRRKSDDNDSDSELYLFPIQRKMRPTHNEGAFSGAQAEKNVHAISLERNQSQMTSKSPAGLMRYSSMSASCNRMEHMEYSANYDNELNEMEQHSSINRRSSSIRSRPQNGVTIIKGYYNDDS